MSPTTTTQAALKRRVRAFYTHLNAGAFEKCFRFLDPRILAEPGVVTLVQYETSLAGFIEHVGGVRVKEVAVSRFHIGQPSKLYEGRDFAIGKTVWEAANGSVHQLAERWVREGGVWYTRATGFVVPEGASTPTPVSRLRKSAHTPQEFVTNHGGIVHKVKPLTGKKATRRPPIPAGTKKATRR